MKRQGLLFRLIKSTIKTFYKTPEFSGVENLPEDATVIISNHAKANGPLAYELYYPRNKFIWVAGQMLHLKEIPSYAYKDFWSDKPKLLRPFYKLLSYILAPLLCYVFNRIHGIGVYKDLRIANTFKNTVIKLKEGNDVVIFPEGRDKYNHVINDFQKNFVDVAKIYYKTTGKELTFTPAYIAPSIKKVVFGKPIKFNASNNYLDEKERIITLLKQSVVDLALSLPPHKVTPYENVSKKKYPISK